MIKAKNYAAEAVYQMRKKLLPWSINNRMYSDADSVRSLCNSMEDSVHFAIPDEGYVLEDGLKGVRNEVIRLPYSQITVEYYTDQTKHEKHGNNTESSSKRVAFAQEVYLKLANGGRDYVLDEVQEQTNTNELFIEVLGISYMDKLGIWIPNTKSALIKSDDWAGENLSSKIVYPGSSDKNPAIAIMFRIAFQDRYNVACSRHGVERANLMQNSDVVEHRAVLELIEALSCSNVHTEAMKGTTPKEVNASVRRRKLPVWETKILTIDTPRTNNGKNRGRSYTGRSSPRQHLRMGHIRRLANGKKVFVNSCVVGSLAVGAIHKDYAVR